MAGIARNVELYNLAFKLAWKYISEDQKRNQPNIARHLDDSIRRQLKEGTTEAVFIASEALKDVETLPIRFVAKVARASSRWLRQGSAA